MLTDYENYGKAGFDVKHLLDGLKEDIVYLSKKEYCAIINHPSIRWDGVIKIFDFDEHHGFEYKGKMFLV